MATICLLQGAAELEEAIQLADHVFRTNGQVSMGTAYPVVFSPSLGQSFGVFEDDKLVAFMGFVPAIIQIEKARLHIYSVGAVCTHEEARGRGYASRLMSAVIEHAQASGASLILVSGHRSIYARAACYPFGSMKRYVLDASHMPARNGQSAVSGIHVRKLQPTDWFRLTELARSRSSRYEQSLTDLAALIQNEAYASNVSFRHQVWVAEHDGEEAAFAVIAVPGNGKESERPSFVVEWAGGVEALCAIYAHVIATEEVKRLQLQVNWYENELQECLTTIPGESLPNSGLVHLVNLEQLCAQLDPYLRARGGSAAELTRRLELLDDEQRIQALFNMPAADGSGITGLPLPFPYTVGLNYV
ncbi:GNAT family N-acetyltransferase [Paenibacillus sp. PAMC21692]|uniref:GNAT family N-acetyltransferase n=1 Tax=Paenibacillus sp. PAMC21692 TaxID=2762320 RepID=UPI00164E9ED0|nr:GNAT family N-acetyltransferase [Paenibacillus sp. PAMC21692]QNK56504.1 GNAT family N-acetyltransferase [Paenibacillus sp. PAMC21692]